MIEQGIEQGLKQGSIIRAKEIAKSMLKEKIDISIISKCTGLSIEQINQTD